MTTPIHRTDDCVCAISDGCESVEASHPPRAHSRRKALRLLMAATISAMASLAPAKETAKPRAEEKAKLDLSGTVFEKVGKAENIDPYLLYSLCCVETAIEGDKSGFIRPYPWTLRHGNRPFYGRDKKHAEQELKRIIGSSKRKVNVDIGLAQVNSYWHGHRVKSLFDLLDPQTNLTVASQILNENFQRFPKDAFKAIGAYHSNEPYKSFRYARYVTRVYTALKGV